MARILTGIQSSGRPHLGNLLGAILPAIELSKTRDFGEAISDSFLFVRQNLKLLLSAFFIFCGFFLLAGTVIGIMQQMKASMMPEGLYANMSAQDLANLLEYLKGLKKK